MPLPSAPPPKARLASLRAGSGGDSGIADGRGAGLVFLNVSDTLTVNGAINANASRATEGAGSGGGIYLIAGTLDGTGTISAQGGFAVNVNDGGGAGGRVALYYKNRTFSGDINISGGDATTAGAEGNYGSLFICETVNATTCTPTSNVSILNTKGTIELRTQYSHNASVAINKTINQTWTASVINWTDASNNVSSFAIYNLTGVTANANFSIYDNGTLNRTLLANASGQLPLFNISLASVHDISVQGAVQTVIGIMLDDSGISFGAGYFTTGAVNTTCSSRGYSVVDSNDAGNADPREAPHTFAGNTSSCWTNQSAFMSIADFHRLQNNGTVSLNVTARGNLNARDFVCGIGAACNTSLANLQLLSRDKSGETGACTGTTSTYKNLSSGASVNQTIGICNSLSSTDATDELDVLVNMSIPHNALTGNKSLIIVYEAIAA